MLSAARAFKQPINLVDYISFGALYEISEDFLKLKHFYNQTTLKQNTDSKMLLFST